MDDRNGECFEHHQDVYNDGAINTSDSEHECLKDFLLEPRDMSCGTDSDRVDNLPGGCLGTQKTTLNDLESEGFLGNCTYIVNSCSEREEESEIPSKRRELITSQNSRSSITETTSSETERNGSYLPPIFSNEDLTNLSESLNFNTLRGSESGQSREKIERKSSSDLSSVVQRDIVDDLRSTKSSDHQVNASNKLLAVPHRPKVQESTKSESLDRETRNARPFEKPNAPKGRNAAPRGRKRKGAETAAKGRALGPAKKRKQPVTYQSQISPDQNGIKIRIKKSSASPSVVQPPRRRERARKRKSKKGSNTEDEESDVDSNKQVKWKDPGASEESEGDEFSEQSDWGLRLPRQALYDIFYMVTQEEGCLPFLIR
jgi:hypothetical protein